MDTTITCTVFEIATGLPAAGLGAEITCAHPFDPANNPFKASVSADGRIDQWTFAAELSEFSLGSFADDHMGEEWKAVFDTNNYYAGAHAAVPRVEINFFLRRGQNFHLQLLVGPCEFSATQQHHFTFPPPNYDHRLSHHQVQRWKSRSGCHVMSVPGPHAIGGGLQVLMNPRPSSKSFDWDNYRVNDNLSSHELESVLALCSLRAELQPSSSVSSRSNSDTGDLAKQFQEWLSTKAIAQDALPTGSIRSRRQSKKGWEDADDTITVQVPRAWKKGNMKPIL